MKKIFTFLMSALIGCSSGGYYKTYPKMELEKFMGKWYVIASRPTSFEEGAFNAVESYNYDQQEKKIEIDFRYNKDSLQGEEKRVPQVGWIYNEQTNTHWKISPLWPFKFDYLILDLDKDYQWTVIGVPNQKYIWVMARSPVMSDESLKRILSATENAGYNIQNVKRISHKN